MAMAQTDSELKSKTAWNVRASHLSLQTLNPIRKIVDQLKPPPPDPEKPLLSLSIGDPTIYGNLKVAPEINKALIDSINSNKYNGYAHSTGYQASRKAVAKKFSNEKQRYEEGDVVLTSGCSGALEISISVLCNPGHNILVPSPGFSLYLTLSGNKGIVPKLYHLLPEKDWEIDLEHLESLIDENTRAIVVNNPSNPCGSVYSSDHLTEILKIAEKHHIPIIADEIYADMVFKGKVFVSMAQLSTSVPILSVGGLAKRFLVPGWRLGWILIHDPIQAFPEVKEGLLKLSTVILGPNTLIQSIIPEILFHTPDSFFSETLDTLEENANFLVRKISQIPGLRPIKPHGAMYMMITIDLSKFKDIVDDVEFCQKLLQEEHLSILPGRVFSTKDCVRVVISPPISTLEPACARLEHFCQRHLKGQ
jgi:tyrosine aminotransferase